MLKDFKALMAAAKGRGPIKVAVAAAQDAEVLEAVRDGMPLTVGDQEARLIHTPGHSEDSICVFLPETGTLFSGDTLYRISDHLGAYPKAYLRSLERLAGLEVRTIFPGHGGPVREDAMGFIGGCLRNVCQSILHD